MLFQARLSSRLSGSSNFWLINVLANKLVIRRIGFVCLQGYIVYSVRHKLKQEYVGRPGTELKILKLSGIEVSYTILVILCINLCRNLVSSLAYSFIISYT